MFFNHLKNLDWLLILTVLLLSGIGLVSIYSSSQAEGDFLNFYKQAVFLGLGFVLMLVFSFIDYRNFKDNSYLILAFYFLCLILLAGLFVFGADLRGVRSWYKLGEIAFSPAEFTKLALIILLAKYFSYRHVELYKVTHIVLSAVYVFLPALLIYLQPDLGSVLVILLVWLGVLVVSGIKLRHFFLLCLVAVVLFSLSWSFFLKDYQKARLISFVMPEYQPLEVGWSQKQAKIAIGSGGLWGKGFMSGSQTQSGFLSEPQTDFIFSAIAEEFGFIAIMVICGLFLLFILRILRIVQQAKDNFSRLFTAGFGVLIIAQFFINLGSNLGFLPVIGIPLPFVSYGGSFLIMLFMGLGMIQNIKLND